MFFIRHCPGPGTKNIMINKTAFLGWAQTPSKCEIHNIVTIKQSAMIENIGRARGQEAGGRVGGHGEGGRAWRTVLEGLLEPE